jgi:endo-1,4-beta-xylanase
MSIKESFVFQGQLKRLKTYQTSILNSALVGILLVTFAVQAQPAKGANKFCGNITTRGQVRSDFLKYWNQITGENESKWGSVEGTRDRMNWNGVDNIANFAKENNIPWKFHTLLWGAQYPSWMNSLSQTEQLEELTEWMDEASKRYPDVQMIDVINEAYEANGGRHAPVPASLKTALGGTGSTGFDWMIKAFQMARQRWPKAILIYNDYNTIEWNNEVNWQVTMAKALKAANAPMDAIGVQAHDAWRVATSTVKSNLDKLAATGYPIIVSEYDIGQSDDAAQKRVMEEQFTMFWNHPKIVGITYWGYVVGSTWRTGTGLLNTNNTERPALTWLVDFLTKNKNPPNDFPSLFDVKYTSVIQTDAPVASIPQYSAMRNGVGLMQLFDLRGRVTGSYYVNDQINPVSSMVPSSGKYIMKLDGKCRGMATTAR